MLLTVVSKGTIGINNWSFVREVSRTPREITSPGNVCSCKLLWLYKDYEETWPNDRYVYSRLPSIGYITQKKFMQKKVNVTSFSSFTLWSFTDSLIVRLRNSVRIVEDQYIVLSKCLSHIKTIPPIIKSKEVKEVNDSLVELDKKVEWIIVSYTQTNTYSTLI